MALCCRVRDARIQQLLVPDRPLARISRTQPEMPIIACQALLQAATVPQYHPSPARHWNAGTARAARRDAAAPRDDAKRREQTITKGAARGA